MGRLVLKRSFQEIAGPAASLAENSWVDGKNCSWMNFLKKKPGMKLARFDEKLVRKTEN